MTDLLLITDVPRLRKIFARLSDNKDVRLRICNNLEKGGEELAAEKPGIVFVQTHLSGLSAEIILMHLKKQLGRKRSRFVLLSPPDQAGSDTMRLYQGHIDTSLSDEALLTSIKDTIAALLAKATKKILPEAAVPADLTPQTEEAATPSVAPPENAPAVIPILQVTDTPPGTPPEELSLVDQGLTYAPRPRMAVYSEFNSSFDSAVNSMQTTTALHETESEPHHDWNNLDIETVKPTSTRSKQAMFLLWVTPVIIAVIAVTMMQHRSSTPATNTTAQTVQTAATSAAKLEALPKPTAQTQQPDAVVVPLKAQNPIPAKTPSTPEIALSDKAVLSAIAENRTNMAQTKPLQTVGRLSTLPDFIPRSALDKSFSTTNPGWERYKGYVTEFKVFRDGTSIKAIQVIDRGGKGVPESFMKAALRQVSKNPTFIVESTEKKEGYEIQRGRVTDNLKVMYYRDDQGGKLRAFVLTWQ